MQMRDIYGLTNEQIAYRAAVHGAGGALSALVVIGLGYAIAGTVCPPVWFALPIFIFSEMLYEQLAVPTVYSRYGLYGAYEPRVHHTTLDAGDLNRRRFIR
jgi:hypothetical protein